MYRLRTALQLGLEPVERRHDQRVDVGHDPPLADSPLLLELESQHSQGRVPVLEIRLRADTPAMSVPG